VFIAPAAQERESRALATLTASVFGKAARPAHSVHVRVCGTTSFEHQYCVHIWQVQSSSRHISRDQHADLSLLETPQDILSHGLIHISVQRRHPYKKTAIAKVCVQ
jgi:hypothetical protein